MEYMRNKYSCCQLVTAINASIFFGGSSPSDAEFERLVDLVGCRYGSAIQVERAYPALGISYDDIEGGLDGAITPLPGEIGINDKEYGNHSVLVIGVEIDTIHIVGGSEEFVTWEDYEQYRARWWRPQHWNLRRYRAFTKAK